MPKATARLKLSLNGEQPLRSGLAGGDLGGENGFEEALRYDRLIPA